jgi:hypothetical protein
MPRKQIIALDPASQVKDADLLLKRDLDSQTDESVEVKQIVDHLFGESRTLSGDFDVTGDVAVTGNSSIDGNQSVSGDIEIAGNLKTSVKNISSNYTAKNGDILLADSTSSSFTITLDSALPQGAKVEIYDPANSWLARNIIVDGDSVNIEGDSTLTLDENGDSVRLIRTASQWRAY